MTKNETLKTLRGRIRRVRQEPVEITRLPDPVPQGVVAGHRQPPPGGWPDDEGWRVEADFYQSQMGEESQV